MNTQVRDGRRAFDVGSIALVVILALAVALSLSACRDSDVLTDKVVGEVDEYELDETLDPVALENPEASSDMSQEEDDSDREDDEEEEDPDYDEDSDDDDQTEQNDEEDYSQSDGDATSGDSVASGSTTSTVSNGGEGSSDAPSITFDFTGDSSYLGENAEDSTSSSGDEGETDSDTWIPSTSSSTGASNEASGTTVVQPGSAEGYSNMATVGYIAAAGSIATLVAAIGGGEVLAACNSDWYDDLPSSAFSDKEELADTVCIDDWGDGSSMADCYKQIANALPQDWSAAVLVDENTYESAYDDYFSDKCIYVVVLEAYGTADVSDDWIADDVEVVAELIGTDYAKSQYQAWKELWTSTLQTVRKANGGYTIWTDHNMGSAQFLYKGTNTFGSNTAITNVSANQYWTDYVYSMPDTTTATVTSGGDSLVWTDFMAFRSYKGNYVWPLGTWASSTSGLTLDISDGLPLQIEGSDQSKWSSKSRWATIDYYLQIAGVVQTAGYENFYVSDSSETITSATIPYTNTSSYANKATRYVGLFACHPEGSSGGFIVAGDDAYPVVIAHSASIASKIVSSAGTADESSMTVGLANVGQDYTVAVMPRGISGSWTFGTFESFLVAPYFYCLFQQGGDLSACDSYVSDFYTTFYRCGASVLTSTSRDKAYGWYGYWVTAEADLG